jgi:hypothetical protein
LLQHLNRTSLGLTPGGAKVLLLVVLALSVAALFGALRLRRGLTALAIAVGAFVIVWNGAGQLSSAQAARALANASLSNVHENPTWLDRATHGQPTLYVGQQVQDPNSVNLLEFWNRSLKQVWSLDGTAPGPGPTVTPDLKRLNGKLFPDPGYPFVVTEPGIVFDGKPVARSLHSAGGRFQNWTLYRVTHPLSLASSTTGLYPDGWSSTKGTQYTQYRSPGNRTGTIAIRVSREDWSGPFVAGHVTIRLGGILIGDDKQPHVAAPFTVRQWTIRRNETKTFVLPTPGPRFRVEIDVDPLFKPIDLAPERTSDARPLGAEISYRFTTSRKRR